MLYSQSNNNTILIMVNYESSVAIMHQCNCLVHGCLCQDLLSFSPLVSYNVGLVSVFLIVQSNLSIKGTEGKTCKCPLQTGALYKEVCYFEWICFPQTVLPRFIAPLYNAKLAYRHDFLKSRIIYVIIASL